MEKKNEKECFPKKHFQNRIMLLNTKSNPGYFRTVRTSTREGH